MLARLVYRLAPTLVAATAVFALLYFYAAYRALRTGSTGFALFYALFACGGLALATAMWRTRQRMGAALRANADAAAQGTRS